MKKSNGRSVESDNAHVRSVQDMRSRMAGGEPSKVSREDMMFNRANMNDATNARRLVDKLTSGLDKAYPIKK